MKFGSFEKTNLGWQFGQVQQQMAEWVELQFSKLNFKGPSSPASSEPMRFEWVEWLLRGLFWVILALLLSWLALQILRLWPTGYGALRDLLKFGRKPAKKSEQQVQLSASGWLLQASEFHRRGDFALACRSLYMAMLQRLNDSGMVANQPARTDGEYRQLLGRLDGRLGYEVLLSTHERQCFGEVPASAEDFERCRQAFGEIEKQ